MIYIKLTIKYQETFIIEKYVLILFLASQLSRYKYLGCFLGENLLSLGDESRVLSPVSTQSCSEFCSKKNYMFFILKNEYDFIALF